MAPCRDVTHARADALSRRRTPDSKARLHPYSAPPGPLDTPLADLRATTLGRSAVRRTTRQCMRVLSPAPSRYQALHQLGMLLQLVRRSAIQAQASCAEATQTLRPVRAIEERASVEVSRRTMRVPTSREVRRLEAGRCDTPRGAPAQQRRVDALGFASCLAQNSAFTQLASASASVKVPSSDRRGHRRTRQPFADTHSCSRHDSPRSHTLYRGRSSS